MVTAPIQSVPSWRGEPIFFIMYVEANSSARGEVTAVMSNNVEETVIEGLRMLPPEQQREVAAFVEELVKKSRPEKTLWQRIDERSREVSVEVWAKIPADGAEQHDHYLYGARKK